MYPPLDRAGDDLGQLVEVGGVGPESSHHRALNVLDRALGEQRLHDAMLPSGVGSELLVRGHVAGRLAMFMRFRPV